jgi:hypothetical protein
MFDLAFGDQLLDRARNVLDGHSRINTMLIEQVDAVGAQSLKRRLHDFADMLRAAVEPDQCTLIIELESEFGRNDQLISDQIDRLTDQQFVRERSVAFGCIEKRHAELEGAANHGNPGLFVGGGAEPEA